MIKRTAALALTILYITTFVGFVLNLNYCCDPLSCVSINTPVKSCSMLSSKQTKCCESRHVNIKLKDVHQNGPSFSLDRVSVFKIAKPFCFHFKGGLYYKIAEARSDKRPSPDPFNTIEACTKNCIFRI